MGKVLACLALLFSRRQINMKAPKFNVGDTVFFMVERQGENEIMSAKIEALLYDPDDHERWRYYLSISSGKLYQRSVIISGVHRIDGDVYFYEDELFSSLEELNKK